ncbi:MAG: hypothetical protein ACKVWR_02605 [Acidimicrobiales bacterium]
MAEGPPRRLEELRARLQAYAELESAVFEVMGGLVREAPSAEAKLLAASQCRHHAWHAELWCARLGELGVAVAPWGAQLAGPRALREALEAQEDPLGRLAALYRVVLPRKLVVYRSHLAGARESADAPEARALRLACRDERDGWEEGEALVQSLLTSPEALARAAAAQAAIEAVWVAAGPLEGAAIRE